MSLPGTTLPFGPNRARYSALAQTFHWVTAVLVLAAFIYGPGGSETRVYSHEVDFDRQLHETLGLAIFAIAALRLLWRAFDKRSGHPPIGRWMDLTSKTVQGLLYFLMFALPLTAVTGAWLEGHPVTLLGDFQITPPIAPAHDIGAGIASLHGWFGDAIMWLAGLHAAAAIFHHLVLRDGVLVSMLPGWFPLRARTHR
jgi:cytochrome b561